MNKLLLPIILIIISGCATNPGVVKIAPDTYFLSRQDSAGIFGSLSALKARVLTEANEYAISQGKVAIPISTKEVQLIPGVRFATFDYQFRVVDKDDPEAKRTALFPRADIVIEKKEKSTIDINSKNESHKSTGIYDDLVKLEDLRQRGILSETEFREQKQQVLKQGNNK